EPETRLIREDLLVAGREADDHQPRQRNASDPDKTRAMHLDKDRSRHTKRDRCQQLIRDPEQRPQGIDAAQWIADSLIQEISPGQYHEGAAYQNETHRTSPQSFVRVTKQILQHESPYARARRDNRQDKQRLEHDRE